MSGSVELYCESKLCPDALYENGEWCEGERWWSSVVGSPADGYERTDPDCPSCGTPGTETGEADFDN